jgi:hypothetical protein
LSETYVEEACFYLSEGKVPKKDIARAFNLTPEQVDSAVKSYKKKIDTGKEKVDIDAKDFWTKNYRESSGDERITMVDDKGRYYHGWKSEVEKLSSEKIVELLVINKQYSDKHPLSEFSKSEAVIGYDPLVPLRDIRRTVSILEGLLENKEKEGNNRKVSRRGESSTKKNS